MYYSFVINGVPVTPFASLPVSAHRLDNGEYVRDLRNATDDVKRQCGYYRVIESAAPALPEGQTADSVLQMVNGEPTQTWVQRPETTEEVSRRLQKVNRVSLQDSQDAQNFITANEAYLSWYRSTGVQNIINGAGNMDAATLSAAVRNLAPQIARITVGLNRITRIVVGGPLLESTEDS